VSFYHLQYAINILQDFIIPKPQDFKTFASQPAIPFIVFNFFEGMPSPIHLYYNSSLKTYKINDITPDRLLSPKFKPSELF